MGDASSLLFSPPVVSSSLFGTPQGDLFGPQSVPSRPFCGLRGAPSGRKAIKNNGFFIFSWCPLFDVLDARDVQNEFQGALWGAIGKCTGLPGSLQEGLQVFGPPPRGPQGASGCTRAPKCDSRTQNDPKTVSQGPKITPK